MSDILTALRRDRDMLAEQLQQAETERDTARELLRVALAASAPGSFIGQPTEQRGALLARIAAARQALQPLIDRGHRATCRVSARRPCTCGFAAVVTAVEALEGRGSIASGSQPMGDGEVPL